MYGVVAILGVTPCLGFALRALPLTPPDFAAGLAVFAAVPTTLGVGEALVHASKGNAALALLLLVGTNALGIFTMPPWCAGGAAAGTRLPAAAGSPRDLHSSRLPAAQPSTGPPDTLPLTSQAQGAAVGRGGPGCVH